MNETIEKAVLRMISEGAMYETTCRMFRLVDGRDYDRVGPDCFTENAVVEYDLMPDKGSGAVLRFSNRDEMTRYLLDVTRHQIQIHAHVVGQTVFDWNGPRPSLTSHVFALHWFRALADRGDLRPADWTALGIVTDEFEERDGRWLIAKRHVTTAGGLVVAGAPPPDLKAV